MDYDGMDSLNSVLTLGQLKWVEMYYDCALCSSKIQNCTIIYNERRFFIKNGHPDIYNKSVRSVSTTFPM